MRYEQGFNEKWIFYDTLEGNYTYFNLDVFDHDIVLTRRVQSHSMLSSLPLSLGALNSSAYVLNELIVNLFLPM